MTVCSNRAIIFPTPPRLGLKQGLKDTARTDVHYLYFADKWDRRPLGVVDMMIEVRTGFLFLVLSCSPDEARLVYP